MRSPIRKKICTITGSRAEFGLLNLFLHAVESDSECINQLVVTGSHLSSKFGKTISDIKSEGFHPLREVDLDLDSDDLSASLSKAITGISKVLQELAPDCVVILGDRYEVFGAAQAACLNRIPIAHIHGGELSEGAMDEVFRHCITKMSHIHFTAANEYRDRVIRMGENPERVFFSGAPALEAIAKISYLTQNKLESHLDFTLGKPTFLVTYHPETLHVKNPTDLLDQLLHALDGQMKKHPELKILFTKSNADSGGSAINDRLDSYSRMNEKRTKVFPSLGQKNYFSAVKVADLVLGNSSSGIIEAPALQCPTVNVGDRQKGRLRSPSVIDCKEDSASITRAIDRALDPDFKSSIDWSCHPYSAGEEPSAFILTKIKNVLDKTETNDLIRKKFYNGEIND